MSMPTVSLLAHLCSLPAECFSLTYDLNVFKSKINRKLFSLGSFYTALLYDVHVFLLFLLALCLVVAVQLCMEWNPISKDWIAIKQSKLWEGWELNETNFVKSHQASWDADLN